MWSNSLVERTARLRPPLCTMLTSDAPGEVRKASAIARRLAMLKTLRGDRRAGGESLVLPLHAMQRVLFCLRILLPLHATELSTPQGKERSTQDLLESMQEQEQCGIQHTMWHAVSNVAYSNVAYSTRTWQARLVSVKNRPLALFESAHGCAARFAGRAVAASGRCDGK